MEGDGRSLIEEQRERTSAQRTERCALRSWPKGKKEETDSGVEQKRTTHLFVCESEVAHVLAKDFDPVGVLPSARCAADFLDSAYLSKGSAETKTQQKQPDLI